MAAVSSAEVEKRILELKKQFPHAKYYLHFSNPLELLVAAILSAQARDEVVNSVTLALFKKYKTAKDYANTNLQELIKDISRISFAGNKAKMIKATCKILVEKHGGRVPASMEELVKLPGIGRKTANTILINAFGRVEGIPVDTWVIKLSQEFGWTKEKNPEKIERDLMRLVPKKHWKEIAYLLKAYGRVHKK